MEVIRGVSVPREQTEEIRRLSPTEVKKLVNRGYLVTEEPDYLPPMARRPYAANVLERANALRQELSITSPRASNRQGVQFRKVLMDRAIRGFNKRINTRRRIM